MIKSLSEYTLSCLAKNVAASGFLWLKPEEGKEDFQVMAGHILVEYAIYLENTLAGVSRAAEAVKQQKLSTQKKIDGLSFSGSSDDTEIAKLILMNDVGANKEILNNLIAEQSELIAYNDAMLSERRKLTMFEDSEPLVKELKDLVGNIFATGGKVARETQRRYQSQLAALINIDTMSKEEVMVRIEAKRGLLVKDLSEAERQLAEYDSMIKSLERKIKEARSTIEIVNKATQVV